MTPSDNGTVCCPNCSREITDEVEQSRIMIWGQCNVCLQQERQELGKD